MIEDLLTSHAAARSGFATDVGGGTDHDCAVRRRQRGDQCGLDGTRYTVFHMEIVGRRGRRRAELYPQ
jgi:hypothetical protein